MYKSSCAISALKVVTASSSDNSLVGIVYVHILFLKAIDKRRIRLPHYSRKDGTVVDAHFAMANVVTDHDQQKVVSGKGTDSLHSL